MQAPIQVKAIYRDGFIQVKAELDLPNDTPVQVLVLPLSPSGKPSLFGLFPQLAAIGAEAASAKDLLTDGLKKQTKTVNGAA